MTRSFFRDAAAAVLVFDVCDPVTLASVRGWVEDFRVSVGGPSLETTSMYTRCFPCDPRSNAPTRS